MIGFLLTIVAAFRTFLESLSIFLGFIGKYLPYMLAWLMIVVEAIRENIPPALSGVAIICITVMLARLIYNLVRGSGA